MKASPQVNSATGKLPQRSESLKSEVDASWRRCMPAPSITPAAALLQRARAMRLYEAMTSGASTPRRPMALWVVGRVGVGECCGWWVFVNGRASYSTYQMAIV